MADFLCINGPNLNLLGSRDPAQYGTDTLADLEHRIRGWADDLGYSVDCLQSNHEGDIIEAIHGAAGVSGIIINPGAFTHTSVAISDAIDAVRPPTVEVHLSNVMGRERFRRRSFIGTASVRTIYGRGHEGYRHALLHLIRRAAATFETIRYGPHPDQIVDLRRSEAASATAILIHGGFWMAPWARDTVEGWAVDLTNHGVDTAVIEYRRLGVGGGHPATRNDVVAAIEAGSTALGGRPVTVVGHSAGGHLAMISGDHHRIVGLGGVYDLAAIESGSPGHEEARQMMASGVPNPLTSPVPGHDLRLVHGVDDDLVPSAQSESFARRCSAGGATVELDLLDGVGHFDYLDENSESWAHIRDTHIL